LKRLLVHVAGFNLSLIMRQVIGVGTPRGLQGLSKRVFVALRRSCAAIMAVTLRVRPRIGVWHDRRVQLSIAA
jgi:hypothetical protein